MNANIVQNNYYSHSLINPNLDDIQTLTNMYSLYHEEDIKISVSKELRKIFKILFNNHDYESIRNILPLMGFSDEDKEIILSVVDFYNKWDVFDYDSMDLKIHSTFPGVLQPIIKQYNQNVKTLKQLSSQKELRMITDLINSAKRMNEKSRYNEAILLLYRVMELISHTKLLKNYKIDSTNINLSRLEELNINPQYIKYLSNFKNSSNIISIGLKEQYCLLRELKDGVAKFYFKNLDFFNEIILTRHSSLLSHGKAYVNDLQYERMEYLVKKLSYKLNKGIKRYLNETEFPKYELN